MNVHEKYMRLAIKLAKKADGMTSPNPLVGAVVVKNGSVVGMGYHRKAGLAHAEVNALKNAGPRAHGATLYVTLEPCDHFGRTPPCTSAIVKSGIKKVVIGMKDPNPLNNGRGIRRLRDNGIEAVTGILAAEAAAMNRPYVKFITKKMPYVTVKAAQTLDGKIATRSGDSKWISGDDSRLYVHRLRSKVDAVMVGANTVMKDDPTLLSKVPGAKQPIRIIVDGRAAIPAASKIFSSPKAPEVILASSVSGRRQRIDLKKLLKALADKGIMHVLVEGGGELIAGLIEKDLVDRLLIFVAPKVVGGRSAITSVEGAGVSKISAARRFDIKNVTRFKDDILIEAEKECSRA
jgi:diaminohydroxyphosphoribosylaminopyrimidine deaminase/5-amino-6-(5-phosphoribosylamino)uracil reductase